MSTINFRTTRLLAVVALVLTASVGTGLVGAAAATTDAQHDDYSTSGSGEVTASGSEALHVSMYPSDDGDQLVLTVAYEGDGAAAVDVSAADGGYEGARSASVDGQETFRLPWPEDPRTIVTSVDTGNATFDRELTFEEHSITCGNASESMIVPTGIEYTATVETPNGTETRTHAVAFATVGDVECPADAPVEASDLREDVLDEGDFDAWNASEDSRDADDRDASDDDRDDADDRGESDDDRDDADDREDANDGSNGDGAPDFLDGLFGDGDSDSNDDESPNASDGDDAGEEDDGFFADLIGGGDDNDGDANDGNENDGDASDGNDGDGDVLPGFLERLVGGDGDDDSNADDRDEPIRTDDAGEDDAADRLDDVDGPGADLEGEFGGDANVSADGELNVSADGGLNASADDGGADATADGDVDVDATL